MIRSSRPLAALAHALVHLGASAVWGAAVGGLFAIGLCSLAACGGGQMLCKPDPITGSQQCQVASDNAATAIVNTGVAAGVYGVTGCTVNGCQLPDECNPKTKRCETIRCREGRACPAGYSCDMATLMCR